MRAKQRSPRKNLQCRKRQKVPDIHSCAQSFLHNSIGRLSTPIISPELNIAILAKRALPNDAPPLANEFLDGDLPVTKDIEVVADDMTVATFGTGG